MPDVPHDSFDTTARLFSMEESGFIFPRVEHAECIAALSNFDRWLDDRKVTENVRRHKFPHMFHEVPNTRKPDREYFQGPKGGQGAKSQSGFKGVRARKGVSGYLVEIRPSKWKRTIWLGTYKTELEAACAFDAGMFYTKRISKLNFPELQGFFPPLPPHLRFEAIDDTDELKRFVKKQALEAARRSKDCGKGGGSSDLTQALNIIGEILNVETKIEVEPPATPDVAANMLDAESGEENNLSVSKLEEKLENTEELKWATYTEELIVIAEQVDPRGAQGQPPHSYDDELGLIPAATNTIIHDTTPWRGYENTFHAIVYDTTSGDSMCRSLEESEEPGSPERLSELESAAEGLSDGSSATHKFQAEVKEDSPSHGTNSNCDGRKRKSIEEDDPIIMLAPFIKKQVEEALNATLLPLVSVLRSREEDEQKHREQLLALEEQKLALKREKLLFKRRRVALSLGLRSVAPRTRSGFNKQQGICSRCSAL